MAAGGRCMMNSISVVLNLMAVLTFSFRNVLMKRHLSGKSHWPFYEKTLFLSYFPTF